MQEAKEQLQWVMFILCMSVLCAEGVQRMMSASAWGSNAAAEITQQHSWARLEYHNDLCVLV